MSNNSSDSESDYNYEYEGDLAEEAKELRNLNDLSTFLTKYSATSKFNENDREFWPKKVLDVLEDKDLIKRVLGITDDSPDEHLQLMDYIHGRAPKLFITSLAVLTLKPDVVINAMTTLKSNGYEDKKLPYPKRRKLGDELSMLNKEVWGNLGSKLWDNQWSALAPVFSTKMEHDDFKSNIILPFTKMKRQTTRGGFGYVHRASLHPDHFQDPNHPVFRV
jgi:hypothetical protein